MMLKNNSSFGVVTEINATCRFLKVVILINVLFRNSLFTTDILNVSHVQWSLLQAKKLYCSLLSSIWGGTKISNKQLNVFCCTSKTFVSFFFTSISHSRSQNIYYVTSNAIIQFFLKIAFSLYCNHCILFLHQKWMYSSEIVSWNL